MATSGSIDFSVTGDDIIKAALRTIGAIATGETPSSDEISQGRQALNMLCKQWTAGPNPVTPGLKMWKQTVATITLSEDTNEYEFKASGGAVTVVVPPVKILSVLLRDSDGHDTPLTEMTWEEWDELYSKGVAADAGTPSKWFYHRLLATGKLYLDREPDDATTYPSVMARYLATIEDFDAAANTPDFPQEWYRPLKYNLAIELAPEYGLPVTEDIKLLAAQSLLLANAIHPEIASENDYFQPGLD